MRNDRIQQQIGTQNGVKKFNLGVEVIKRHVNWARMQPGRLDREVEEMIQQFPDHICVMQNSNHPSCVMECPSCGRFLVFEDHGLKCVNCDQYYNPPNGNQILGYYGKLMGLLGRYEDGSAKGRPFLKKTFAALKRMRPGSDRDYIQSYFYTTGDKKIYFTPPLWSFFSNTWPFQRPTMLFHNDYFKILDIPSTHILGHFGLNFTQLCNYGNWRRPTMRTVIVQRIVPRLLIDLMMADLKAVGKLDETLRRIHPGNFSLRGQMYALYNDIGRNRRSQEFQDIYDEYVDID